MNLLRLISSFLIVVILSSCSILGSDSISSKIVGQWKWIRSTGGFTGETITPDSAGVPDRHLIFNFNSTFFFFQSDTLVQTGEFSMYEKDGDVVIDYDTENDNFSIDQRVRFQGNDTLILADECSDCYNDYYIRNE